MEFDFSDLKLSNHLVRLETMTEHHFSDVCQTMIPDPDGWYSVMFGLNTPEAYRKEFIDARIYTEKKIGMGFTIFDIASNRIAGISFFLKMDFENRNLEIGKTNIAPTFRRTYVNTAVKLLMLQYAFEKLKCIRVSFRVDSENLISRKAVERLGAKLGGTLRNERILPNGRVRDYCFYSIIDTEWPQIKSKIESQLSINKSE